MQISGPNFESRRQELGWVVDPMGIFVNPKQKEAIQKKKNIFFDKWIVFE